MWTGRERAPAQGRKMRGNTHDVHSKPCGELRLHSNCGYGIKTKRHETMLKKSWILAVSLPLLLAGCLENDAERALVGAGAGCVAGETLGNNNCVEGALAGGLAGALLNDL